MTHGPTAMTDLAMLACFTFDTAAVAIGPLLGAQGTPRRDRIAMAVAVLHPLTTLGLFYSLALHMHRQLAGWPSNLGDDGFPRSLAAHADVALGCFGSQLLGSLIALPLGVLVCALEPSLRPGLRHLGAYGIASVLTFAAMRLAPEPFLHWWWD